MCSTMGDNKSCINTRNATWTIQVVRNTRRIVSFLGNLQAIRLNFGATRHFASAAHVRFRGGGHGP